MNWRDVDNSAGPTGPKNLNCEHYAATSASPLPIINKSRIQSKVSDWQATTTATGVANAPVIVINRKVLTLGKGQADETAASNNATGIYIHS